MMNQTLEKLGAMRFSMLVDVEWIFRQNKKLAQLLKEANLRDPSANLENVDYRPSRKLDKAQIVWLSDLHWIGAGRNLFITGACGTGKTWLASAFGNAACRQDMKVQSVRVSRLLGDLLTARSNGTWAKLLTSLKIPDLLTLGCLHWMPSTATIFWKSRMTGMVMDRSLSQHNCR